MDPPSRRDPRFEVSIPVDYATQAMFVSHHVTNLSRGGLFIEGGSLPLDSLVTLRLQLVGEDNVIIAQARVVWTYDIQTGSAHLVQGMGLRFIDLSREDLLRLSAYLAKLAPKVSRPSVSPIAG